jgi:hypothetical protein
MKGIKIHGQESGSWYILPHSRFLGFAFLSSMLLQGEIFILNNMAFQSLSMFIHVYPRPIKPFVVRSFAENLCLSAFFLCPKEFLEIPERGKEHP